MMERAFWDVLQEGLQAQPWQWQRLAALIHEAAGSLASLIPARSPAGAALLAEMREKLAQVGIRQDWGITRRLGSRVSAFKRLQALAAPCCSDTRGCWQPRECTATVGLMERSSKTTVSILTELACAGLCGSAPGYWLRRSLFAPAV